ncbi:hypothetical protein TNCT_672311 [Trichonephila clavata]|uniref:Uncharacterized protein n=1 Tax=Trichonephila clavata TaxID=2740835 RepID=A0A8X6FGD0_TRICU|nr:hypothetical protein TNCT_672311 [Trichonephila clavata]
MQGAREIAAENSAKNQERMISHYNLSLQEKISAENEVLILTPSSTHKLLIKWIGQVKGVHRSHSCLEKNGSTRQLLVSKLRPYITRIEQELE